MDKRIKVCILDDEKSYRHVLEDILEKDERIAIVGEYAYATEFLQSLYTPFKPDVCLLDIMLTGDMSGIDCAYQVKEVDPNIQIIFITGHPDSPTLLEAKKLNADYIEKGTIGEGLINKIITSVSRKEQLVSLQYDTSKKYNDNFISLLENLAESQSQVSRLTDYQKTVLRYRQQGMTIKEIAELLNMNKNTVMGHIERGLKKLKIPDSFQYIDLS
jgi:DNA-binding NarL/FixJ family response regulator